MDIAEFITGKGAIRIADKALASLARDACLSVEGVASMDTGLGSSISSMIGLEDAAGVHVSVRDNKAAVALYILVRHGIRVPELALRVQEKVKEVLTEVGGVAVTNVDIYIEGILFGNEADANGKK